MSLPPATDGPELPPSEPRGPRVPERGGAAERAAARAALACRAWRVLSVAMGAAALLLAVRAARAGWAVTAATWALTIGLAAGWAAITAALAGGRGRAALARLTPRLAVLGAASVAGLLALEGALRAVTPAAPYDPRVPLHPGQRIEWRGLTLRGVAPRATFTTNRWGLRGDEPPPDWDAWRTVVCVGGSTTACTYLDDRRTWPHLVQERLRRTNPHTWVGNAGCDGHSTRGHLLVVREVVARLRPDVVVFLVGHNDLSLSLAEDWRTTTAVDDAGVSQDTFTRVAGRVVGSSRLLQVVRRWWLVLFDATTVRTDVAHQSYEPVPLDGPEDVPSDLAAALPQLPELRENVRELVRTCREAGIRPVFVTQPELFDDTEAWRSVRAHAAWVGLRRMSAATHARLLAVYNAAVRETCREVGADCLDLAALVPRTLETFYDPAHFTERGAELVAERVAGFLEPLLPGRE